MRMRPLANTGDAGFSLVEVLVAAVILTTTLSGMAHLLAVATVQYADVRESAVSLASARAKLEELGALAAVVPAAVAVGPDGSDPLLREVPGHFDEVAPGVTRRWRVTAGPTPDTVVVTVRVLNVRARHLGTRLDLATVVRHGG